MWPGHPHPHPTAPPARTRTPRRQAAELVRARLATLALAALLVGASPLPAQAADATSAPPAWPWATVSAEPPAEPDLAALLRDGEAATVRGEFPLALSLADQAVALAERRSGSDSTAFATALALLGNVHVSMGHNAEALALEQRTLALRERLLGPDHPDTATVLRQMGVTLWALGQYDQALPLLQRALAICERALGSDHPGTAFVLDWLGAVQVRLGRNDLALPLKQRALAIIEKAFGPDDPTTASMAEGLARVHINLGQYAQALALNQRALAIREASQGADHFDVAVSLNDLAFGYSRMGRQDLALPLRLRAQAIQERVAGPDHADTATMLSNLAITYAALGQRDKALPLQQRVLAIREKALGPDHPITADALGNLAQSLGALDRQDEALPLLLRATAIREKTLGPDHPVTALGLSNLARAQTALGQPALALQIERRALAIREKTTGPDHPETASSLANLGQIQALLGQPEQALPLLQRAHAIYEKSFGSEHPSTAVTLAQLARVHLTLGDQGFAIALLKQSVNAYQALRERAARIDSAALRSYTGMVASTYQRLAEALTDAGRLPEAQLVLDMLKEDEQFDFIRRSATDAPGRTRIGYNPAEQAWTARYREIAGRLAALGAEEQALKKLGAKSLSAEQKQRQQALAADLAVAQSAFADFLTGMREDFARQGPARGVELAESSVKALGELRALLQGLGDGAVLLQIYLTDDRVNLLLTSPGVQLARSSSVSAKDLNRQIAQFRRLLRDPASDPLPAAQALYKLLIAPVAQDLEQAGAKTVMLSLDGALRYLPFGALHDGQRYLLQRWALPLYTSVTRDRLRDAVAPQWQAAGLGLTRKLGDFDPLPGVQAEMDGIIRTAGSGPRAAGGGTGALPGEVYLDQAFTAQRLKDVSQRRFPVLHLASHFRFSPGTEANSFLLLGDGQQLTLGDLRTQNYRFDNVDLLTLSACDTGLGGGRDERGREIEGFGVIAQQQGAKAVLATLWPVADQSTARLMADLYRQRQERQLSKIEALRQAQRGLQSQPRTSHPFYWAPFILMGNWK